MLKKIYILVFNALIAAIYASITLGLSFMSFGQLQIRVSEALTILPFFSGYSVIGLTLGCFTANLFSPIKLDLIFGTLATFLGAILTYIIGKSNIPFKKYIAPLPPVLINAVIVGIELKVVFNTPFIINAFWVALGEAIACYGLGIPLIKAIEKNKVLKRYLTFNLSKR